MPRVVFDPDIPEAARDVLAANAPLLPHPSAAPPRPRFGGRGLRTAGLAAIQAPIWVYLPAVACWQYGKWARVAGIAAEAVVIAPIALFGLDGFAWNTLLGAPLQMIAFLVVLLLSGEPELPKLIRRHKDGYIRPEELDGPAPDLLARAQAAVDGVIRSEVNREGLLDEVRNTITLPRQLWDVGQTLAELTRLHDEQTQRTMGLSTPRVVEALRPQRRALNLATESVIKRVEALERYAARTRVADQALLELRALHNLAEGNDAYRDLLARTVRDDLAIAEIDDLAERARQIEEALYDSVEQARRAGLSLVPQAS
ncbi:hypothetical protein [Actinomadura verrucosospora]|uniref:Uncharacterized protein n=1 Tax=Actinomadura verrucosospora TaxID=46165 RepID=A0A7D3W0G1_ACTVE|nr:hypothetical protein [Actinomadura verrucosospora]QKG23211.1 hypothetical protein ACTIVE_4852 [Actinomadura verrucosospora]